jgi:4-amino-4-deoxy-L-arabinose transferase-like glycosyltransferase
MIPFLHRISSQRHFSLAAATLLGAVLIFSRLGVNGIANYDDCFYAQKAKEVLGTGSWMTLHHAGVPSFENPPGFIWLQAFSYLLFGVGDFGAIFPSALFGVLTIVLVWFFARELLGPASAGPSSFVMATTFFFIKYARHAMIDVALTFFVTLALYAALLAVRRNGRYFLLWGAAVSVCVLMKSVLGFFPPLITVLFLLITGRGRELHGRWFLAGSALVFTLGCSWYYHEYFIFGSDFTRLHFSWLIVQRGFAGNASPWYSHFAYIADIATTYWPWLPVFAWGSYRLWGRARAKDEASILLLIWPTVIIAVMSLMQTRSAWYIMPAYPAAAITCGGVIGGWASQRFTRAAALTTAAAAVIAALVINLVPVNLSSEREKDVRTLAPLVRERARAGARVVGYEFDFHSVNNALLFYSDYPARPVFSDPAGLRSAMEDTTPVLCILYTRNVDGILPNLPGASVLMKTDGLTLLTNGR